MKGTSFSVCLPASYHAKPVAANMASIRAARFENALKAYMQSKGNAWDDNSAHCWLADMLADAFHWCRVNEVDTEFVIKMAHSHFESELLEDMMRSMTSPAPGERTTTSLM